MSTRTQANKAQAPAATHSTGLLLQRKCGACGDKAAGFKGECEDCDKKRLVGLQPKLAVGAADDHFEREADRVAERVLSAPAPGLHEQAPPAVRRQAVTPVGPASGRAAFDAPPVVHETLNSPGQPLDAPTRSFMESRFGHDFSRVRVHTDARAAQSAAEVRALAYTVGHDLVFAEGQYTPLSPEGRRLLAHELAHVIQQGGAGDRLQRTPPPGGTPTPVLPSTPVVPAVTPEIEARLVSELQTARSAAPAAQTVWKESMRTFASAAVIKPDGSVTYHSAYFDKDTPGAGHAEAQVLRKIAGKVQPGDTVAIAVDQVPCAAGENCSARLHQHKENPRQGSLRVYTVRALRRDAPPTADPKTVPRENLTSPKTAIKRLPEERFLFEEKQFRRVRLPIYREPKPAPGATPQAPASVTPPAGAIKAPPVKVPPPEKLSSAMRGKAGAAAHEHFGSPSGKGGGTKGKGGKGGKGGASGPRGGPRGGMKGGPKGGGNPVIAIRPVVEDLLLGEAKEEWAREELEQEIESRVNAKLSGLRPEIEKLLAQSPKEIHAHIKVTIETSGFSGKAEVTDVEVKLATQPAESSQSEGEGILSHTMVYSYSALLIDVEEEAKRQEREREQAILNERLQQAAKRRQEEQKKVIGPPLPPASTPAKPPSLLPAPEPEAPALLPGAPGPGPIQQAAEFVSKAKAMAASLISKGNGLRGRVHSGVSPSDAERKAFRDEVANWRDSVRYMKNWLTERGRSEAVSALDELLHVRGGELQQIVTDLLG